MRFGVIAVNLKDGFEAWCLSNGKPIGFDFAYEAVYFAKQLNEATKNPQLRYEPQLLPLAEVEREEEDGR